MRSAALVCLTATLALTGCGTATQTTSSGGENVAIEPRSAPETPAAPPPAEQGGEAQAGTERPEVAALPSPDQESGRLMPMTPQGVSPVIKVGLLLPLTGPHGKLGQGMLNAAQLALFSMASDEMALLPFDTKGTPDGAAQAARQALGDGAQLILGPVFSTSVQAVAPVAQAAGIQVVSFSNNRAVAGNGVYVMGFAPQDQVRRVMAYSRDRGLKRFVAMVPEGPFGDLVADTLQRVMPELGLDLKTIARYQGRTTQELSPLVQRIADYGQRRAALLKRRKELEALNTADAKRELKRLERRDTLGDVDFDAVFLPQGGPGLLALAPLLRFYDIDPRKVRVLGTVDWNDPALATEPALYGGWFTAPPPSARAGFENAYRSAFGGSPLPVSSLAYDATAMAAVLVRRRGTPAVASADAPGPVRMPGLFPGRGVFSLDALTSSSGFAGADGIFRLLPTGLVERGYAVMEVRARRFVVVSPAPRSFRRLSN